MSQGAPTADSERVMLLQKQVEEMQQEKLWRQQQEEEVAQLKEKLKQMEELAEAQSGAVSRAESGMNSLVMEPQTPRKMNHNSGQAADSDATPSPKAKAKYSTDFNLLRDKIVSQKCVVHEGGGMREIIKCTYVLRCMSFTIEDDSLLLLQYAQ